MKRRELEQKFKKKGWYVLRHGGNHDIWTDGVKKEQLPRHPNISEYLAKSLIRKHKL